MYQSKHNNALKNFENNSDQTSLDRQERNDLKRMNRCTIADSYYAES